MASRTKAGAEAASAGTWQMMPVRRFADFFELTKPRVTTLVLVTTTVGFYLGTRGSVDLWRLFNTLLGTGLAACGSSTLNQFLERTHDKMMRRTENRPLPAQRLSPAAALGFGTLLAIAGVGYLIWQVNLASGLLTLLVLASYLFLYTPLKLKTSLCTAIGAVPGAIPPVIGWAASGRSLDAGAASLFLILFLWQFPHFFAIAWMYRDDYERAGFRMLPLLDRQGYVTGQQILIYLMALLPVSLVPSLVGITGNGYLVVALPLGLFYLYFGLQLARSRNTQDARKLLKASVTYLPLLLATMVLDKAQG